MGQSQGLPVLAAGIGPGAHVTERVLGHVTAAAAFSVCLWLQRVGYLDLDPGLGTAEPRGAAAGLRTRPGQAGRPLAKRRARLLGLRSELGGLSALACEVVPGSPREQRCPRPAGGSAVVPGRVKQGDGLKGTRESPKADRGRSG